MREEEGRLLTPSQVFHGAGRKAAGGAEGAGHAQDSSGDGSGHSGEDSPIRCGLYASLMETMDNAGDEWRGLIRIYTGRLKYRMMDENGSLLRSNTSAIPDLEFEKRNRRG